MRLLVAAGFHLNSVYSNQDFILLRAILSLDSLAVLMLRKLQLLLCLISLMNGHGRFVEYANTFRDARKQILSEDLLSLFRT